LESIHPNTAKFRSLVKEYGLTLKQVATITRRSYQRAKDWHSGKYHTVPDSMLELIELKLKDLRDRELI
jgi:hypothetical protein